MRTNDKLAKAQYARDKYSPNFEFSREDIDFVEKELNIFLSPEFKTVYEVFPYDAFLSFEFLSFPTGIMNYTNKLRKNRNLPLNTLVLATDEVSLLLMKCLGDHEEIYWIDYEDYESYCNNEPFIYNPTNFPTFGDFFEYLLEEEEKKEE